MTAPDEQEDDVRIVAKRSRRPENGFEFMSTPQISRIADDELALQPPVATEAIEPRSDRPDCDTVGPVVNDRNSLRRDPSHAQISRHSLANDDVHSCAGQGAIPQSLKQP
jgi:hypothetical protein